MDILEKVKLAEEVGMGSWASERKAQLEAEAEIKKLTDMKFKVTTTERIRKQICGHYWSFDEGSRELDGFGVVIFLCGILGALVGGISVVIKESWPVFFSCVGGGVIVGLLICIAISRRTSQLKSMPLEEWSDNIPYGALLAVKEGKEKGLGDFKIYFPTKQSVRLKNDPVIIGRFRRNGPMIEVFAWDDGKVYE